MRKRGQTVFGISFGALFSIFIIILIIAVGFFVIRSLLDVNECAEMGLFKKELQDQIDDAWASGSVNKYWPNSEGSATVPKNVEAICFGTLDLPSYGESSSFKFKFESLNTPDESNIYFYPPNVCMDLFYNKLDKAHFASFFCINTTNGKLEDSIRLRYDDRKDVFVNVSSS